MSARGINVEVWFNPDYDMTKIKDSMQIDSGETICSLKIGNTEVTIEVRGDVRVEYNGKDGSYDVFRCPSEFPKFVKVGLTKEGSPFLYGNPELTVWGNNWFEAFISVDGEYLPSTTLVDVEGYTKKELFDTMKDFYLEYIKDLIENISSDIFAETA